MPPKKKTKPIAKDQKPEKSASNREENQDNGEIFTQSFKDRLDSFGSLTKEVLTIKANLEGSSPNEEIKEKRQRVRQKVEEASNQILKGQLQSLQEWIAEQQKNIADQVSRIHNAYDQTKKTLQSTGAFSGEEIQSHIQPIRDRANEKQAIHDSYGALLQRSKNIYDS